jgi:hypothetical protein
VEKLKPGHIYSHFIPLETFGIEFIKLVVFNKFKVLKTEKYSLWS